MQKNICYFVSIFSFIFIFNKLSFADHKDSSVIGNGGSLLRALISQVRAKTLQTFNIIEDKINKNKHLNFLCESDTSFTKSQQEYCAQYIKDLANKVISLYKTNQNILSFSISDKPLFAKNENEELIEVDAITANNPNSPIVFNTQKIKLYSPTQILFLWFHEIGHKILYDNTYIKDYNPIGPFDKGHILLDAAANSLVFFAKQENLISDKFVTLDYYDLEYYIEGLEFPIFKFTGATQRLFIEEDNVNLKYETFASGFDGKNPFWNIVIRNPKTGEEYYPQLLISHYYDHELSQIKYYTSFKIRKLKDNTLIINKKIESLSPIINHDTILTIEYENLILKLKYVGSITCIEPTY